MRALFTAVIGVSLVACGVVPTKETHPEDAEKPAPSVTEGACDGVPVVSPESLFVAPYRLAEADARPAEGARVAFEGAPRGMSLCTQRGCAFECCDNSCGYAKDCAYALTAGAYNRVCLSHAGFACGGTDCSGFCTPFGSKPEGRYRFVGTVRYPEGSLGGATLEVTAYCKL